MFGSDLFNEDLFNQPGTPADFALAELSADAYGPSVEFVAALAVVGGPTPAAVAWTHARPHPAHIPAEFQIRELSAQAVALEVALSGGARFTGAAPFVVCVAQYITPYGRAKFIASPAVSMSSCRALVASGAARFSFRDNRSVHVVRRITSPSEAVRRRFVVRHATRSTKRGSTAVTSPFRFSPSIDGNVVQFRVGGNDPDPMPRKSSRKVR